MIGGVDVFCFTSQVRCHSRALGGAWTQPSYTHTQIHMHADTPVFLSVSTHTIISSLSIQCRRTTKHPHPCPYTQAHTHAQSHIQKHTKQGRINLQTSSLFIWYSSAFLSPLPPCLSHTLMNFSLPYSSSLSYSCLKLWYPSGLFSSVFFQDY